MARRRAMAIAGGGREALGLALSLPLAHPRIALAIALAMLSEALTESWDLQRAFAKDTQIALLV